MLLRMHAAAPRPRRRPPRLASFPCLPACLAPPHRPPLPARPPSPQVHDLESLHTELAEAVEAEDYRAAAALAAQRRQLEACDCVGEALGALEAAVAEERFGGERWGPRRGACAPWACGACGWVWVREVTRRQGWVLGAQRGSAAAGLDAGSGCCRGVLPGPGRLPGIVSGDGAAARGGLR